VECAAIMCWMQAGNNWPCEQHKVNEIKPCLCFVNKSNLYFARVKCLKPPIIDTHATKHVILNKV